MKRAISNTSTPHQSQHGRLTFVTMQSPFYNLSIGCKFYYRVIEKSLELENSAFAVRYGNLLPTIIEISYLTQRPRRLQLKWES